MNPLELTHIVVIQIILTVPKLLRDDDFTINLEPITPISRHNSSSITKHVSIHCIQNIQNIQDTPKSNSDMNPSHLRRNSITSLLDVNYHNHN